MGFLLKHKLLQNVTVVVSAKKREFVKRRKLHYNEYQAVKLARQLIENDDEDEDEDDQTKSATSQSLAATTMMASGDCQEPCEMDTSESRDDIEHV